MNTYFSLYFNVVRLNLFNHVLALFRAKFACNSTIRNSVFRWELCKGCVWESEELIKCVHSRAFSWLELAIDSRVVTRQKCHTCGACKKLKGHDSWITTGQKVHFGHYVSWQLELMTHPNRESLAKAPCFAEKWFFTFLLIPYYKYPYTHTLL